MLKGSVCWSTENGDRFWYRHLSDNTFHRTDGPAIEYSNGGREWWLNGERIDCSSQKEFERYLNLISFV
jgi:hypothetical protein